MPTLFSPFQCYLVLFLNQKVSKNVKNSQFFRFFVMRPSEENNCWRSKYFDLVDTMLFFWMHTLHVMIRCIKKMSIYFGLNFVALWKLLTKFCNEKGPKTAIFGPISQQTMKKFALSVHATYTKPIFFWIYIPKPMIISKLIMSLIKTLASIIFSHFLAHKRHQDLRTRLICF